MSWSRGCGPQSSHAISRNAQTPTPARCISCLSAAALRRRMWHSSESFAGSAARRVCACSVSPRELESQRGAQSPQRPASSLCPASSSLPVPSAGLELSGFVTSRNGLQVSRRCFGARGCGHQETRSSPTTWTSLVHADGQKRAGDAGARGPAGSCAEPCVTSALRGSEPLVSRLPAKCSCSR